MGLLEACLPALLISLSIHCSTVVVLIIKKHNVAPSGSAGLTVVYVLAQTPRTPSRLLVQVLDISLTFADICDYV